MYTANQFEREIDKYNVLSAEEETVLGERLIEARASGSVADVETIRNLLVNHNLRLVKKIANDYPPCEDLVAEGCIGLVIGINKYDPTRARLSTYVIPWIRAYMLAHIVKSARLVKLGTTEAQRKLFFNLNKEKAKLAAQGIEFTPEAIAERLDVTEREVVEMDQRLIGETRLDAPLSLEEGLSRLDMLECGWLSAEEALAEAEQQAHLCREFEAFRATLTAVQRTVFDSRMVDGTEESETLQSVGDRLGYTREYVRKIQLKVETNLKKFLKVRGVVAIQQLAS